jgi:hypothetical protein
MTFNDSRLDRKQIVCLVVLALTLLSSWLLGEQGDAARAPWPLPPEELRSLCRAPSEELAARCSRETPRDCFESPPINQEARGCFRYRPPPPARPE